MHGTWGLILIVATQSLAVAIFKTDCVQTSLDEDQRLYAKELSTFVASPANVYVMVNIMDQDGRPMDMTADLVTEQVTIKEDGAYVPRDAIYTIVPAKQWKATLIAFLISHSFNTEQHMEHVREAIASWFEQLKTDENVWVTIALVTAHIHALMPVVQGTWTNNLTQALTDLDGFHIESRDHSVNLNGAIIDMVHDMQAFSVDKSNSSLLVRRVLVLITDSGDRAHRFSEDDVLSTLASAQNVNVYALVHTNAPIPAFISTIATYGSIFVSNVSDISLHVSTLVQQLSRIGKNPALIGYCTPSRDGSHTVSFSIGALSPSIDVTFDASAFQGDECDRNAIQQCAACPRMAYERSMDTYMCQNLRAPVDMLQAHKYVITGIAAGVGIFFLCYLAYEVYKKRNSNGGQFLML